MYYGGYKSLDVVNGVGTRCSLFVSGCDHMCKGCFSQKTWNPTFGEVFTKEVEDKIIADLNSDRIKLDGISLLGGDPMHKANAQRLVQLCHRIRTECKGKTIWLWTGYTKQELDEDTNPYRKALLSYIDVLVDGKFEKDLYDPALRFKGSSNQNVIYMEKQ